MNETTNQLKPGAAGAYRAKAYGAASATSTLAGMEIPRRHPTEQDVQIEILYCGICHSDLHYTRNDWDVLPAS
ncbi:MAG: Alcohol dehydrogenase zinc-binding domain protein, partial [Ramlibacter sp.]|nr:Alcohol dehydrogenase zinc-binding domain protein [Ramlibacter sp.]